MGLGHGHVDAGRTKKISPGKWLADQALATGDEYMMRVHTGLLKK